MDKVPISDIIRRRALPWVFWGGLIAAAVWLYRGIGPGAPVQGFAEALPYKLSATEPARVESLLVKPGDRVRAGQVVAILDASTIEAELRVVEADKARVLAEVAKAEIEARAAHLEQARTQADDRGQVERAARDARTRLETARAELRAVDAELARRGPLVKSGVLTTQDLTDLQIRKAALARTVSEEQAALNLLGGQAEATAAFSPPAETTWVEAVKAPLAEEARMLESQATLLKTRRDQFVLRAPVDGVVTTVLGGPQTVVTPQLPFIEIVSESSGRVVACVIEGSHGPIAQGSAATVRPISERSVELVGRSVSVSPVMELPARCWRDARFPMWGRIVTVELVPPTPLVPGESFEVRFDTASPSGT
ncbi:MAG: biotin/lipoyl-binding protein [Deltaproteobacteria bacterium]|nr:biotin/lipoyl-binding protein [Deltaproteobacteria bacterium]